MGEAKMSHLPVGGFLRKGPMSPGVSLLGWPTVLRDGSSDFCLF